MDLATASMNYASTQLGIHEEPKGSNSGPEVDAYLAYVGLKPGAAWCAAFVSYCINQASINNQIDTTFKKSASALHLATNNPTLVMDRYRDPIANCIGIIDEGGGKGHTFFIPFVDNQNNAHTIEGNTDHLGSREGWEVAARVRDIDSITYFLRIN